MKDLTPKLDSKLKPAYKELEREYQAGQLPFGQNLGGTQMYSSEFKRGYGDDVFGSSQLGIWLGAADFGDAPFSVDMQGNLVASSADFSGSGYTKINIFKQAGVPTSVAVGDLWFDTDDNNKMYRAASIGADEITAGEWEEVSPQGISIFKQDSIPTSLKVGDLWFDTDDDNKIYRAASAGADEITAGEWEAVSTQGVTIFAQDSIPTSLAEGDLWYDTNDDNKVYRAASAGADEITAGEWEAVYKQGITVFAQDSIPTSLAEGDLWYDTNDDNKPYRAASAGADQITAGEWEAVDDQRAADAILKAGTSQNLSGDIEVGTGNVKIDGANKRILISDGTDDRILIGYDSGGF